MKGILLTTNLDLSTILRVCAYLQEHVKVFVKDASHITLLLCTCTNVDLNSSFYEFRSEHHQTSYLRYLVFQKELSLDQ